MKRSKATVPALRPITKPLFEAGVQCSKRLYIEFNQPKQVPGPDPHQQELQELGKRLVELASQAFPKGLDFAESTFDEAVTRTGEFLAAGHPGVLFHAAFRGGGAEVATDIVLVSGKNEIDIFEVKAGTSIKPRHLTDVAMQVHAIEAGGVTVKSASVLHLDPRYVHDGTKDYPVQKLFKSEDVTSRARNQLGRVQEQIASFQGVVTDAGMLELPTGTWCRSPLPCPHLARCIGEGPDDPLVELPQLSTALERRLHEEAIETIRQLDPGQTGLSGVQRRAVRAILDGKLFVEPFVGQELTDIDWPLLFVHVGWHLDPLPRFARSRPWQKLPSAWSAHRVENSGRTYVRSFVAATADDPRPEALRTLAEEIKDAGTVIVFGRGWDERFRALLEDLPDLKSELRVLLGASLLEIGNLIFHGLYHPALHGNFDQDNVYAVLSAALGRDDEEVIEGLTDPGELEIATDGAAEEAFRKIFAKRTRAATREKLAGQLEAFAKHSSAALLRIHRLLLGTVATPPSE